MYYENGTMHKQTVHISRIMMSDELYPMVSDVYFGNGEHTFELCETMQRFVLQNESSYRYIQGVLVHDFLETELAVLDNEYMATIYKPQSFPYTYRKMRMSNSPIQRQIISIDKCVKITIKTDPLIRLCLACLLYL